MEYLPRNANMLAEVRAFVSKGEFSDNTLSNLHIWIQGFFHDRGVVPPLTTFEKSDILTAAHSIETMQIGEHRGRPRDAPLHDLIKRLRRVFRAYYCKEKASGNRLELAAVDLEDDHLEPLRTRFTEKYSKTRDGKRAIARADKEAAEDEREFIIAVLDTAGISHPLKLGEKLKTIGQAPQNRVEHLNQIAKRIKVLRTKPSA